ncbi:MAG: SoxR reducing system RseC family protein [Betaproteobacteria bacterium]|nr:SoxR reducing system RseC family protein [Betaproteobacteria bacterium]MCL2887110.1 SoxR reducing system RseC family protein [Betaproteobacteria bacterium]
MSEREAGSPPLNAEPGGSTVCGVVRALRGRQAEVVVDAGGCGRCYETGGCGGQHLARMFASGPRSFFVDNALGVAVGERVTIAIAAGSVRRAANLAYGLPLLAVIAGALAGNALFGELGGIGGAALAFAASLCHLRWRSQALAGNPAERPHLVSRS